MQSKPWILNKLLQKNPPLASVGGKSLKWVLKKVTNSMSQTNRDFWLWDSYTA